LPLIDPNHEILVGKWRLDARTLPAEKRPSSYF
jgi:hypothetical protein